MKVAFTCELRFDARHDQLSVALDQVMEELIRLGVEDPAIGGSMTSGGIEISLTMDAESPEEAIPKGAATVRSAVHAAQVATPNWPAFDKRSVRAAVIEPADA
jgi:hypothetical protein